MACVEGIEVLSFRQIAEEKKMTGMTILAGADYLVSPKEGVSLPADWKERFAEFMAQSEIRVIRQTKKSEREVDILPMIYKWEYRDESLFFQLAAGSSENLKPDLVMDAFLEYADLKPDLSSGAFSYHRLEMYANADKDGGRSLVTLESLGTEIPMENADVE